MSQKTYYIAFLHIGRKIVQLKDQYRRTCNSIHERPRGCAFVGFELRRNSNTPYGLVIAVLKPLRDGRHLLKRLLLVNCEEYYVTQ